MPKFVVKALIQDCIESPSRAKAIREFKAKLEQYRPDVQNAYRVECEAFPKAIQRRFGRVCGFGGWGKPDRLNCICKGTPQLTLKKGTYRGMKFHYTECPECERITYFLTGALEPLT